MPHLHVSVKLHGLVVDQRLCTVADEVWLGDHARAEVAFPGATLRVRRFGERLQAHGVWLDPGRVVRVTRGPVQVEFEAVLPRRLPRVAEWAPDLRLLLASAAVVLFGASWDAAGAFVRGNQALLASVLGERPIAVVLDDAARHHPVPATASADAAPPTLDDLDLPPADIRVLPPTVRWSPR